MRDFPLLVGAIHSLARALELPGFFEITLVNGVDMIIEFDTGKPTLWHSRDENGNSILWVHSKDGIIYEINPKVLIRLEVVLLPSQLNETYAVIRIVLLLLLMSLE